jgi:hypothetical protein
VTSSKAQEKTSSKRKGEPLPSLKDARDRLARHGGVKSWVKPGEERRLRDAEIPDTMGAPVGTAKRRAK